MPWRKSHHHLLRRGFMFILSVKLWRRPIPVPMVGFLCWDGMLMNVFLLWFGFFFFFFSLPRTLFLCVDYGWLTLDELRVFWQDMSKQPPTQELVAKDLHANEWRFKHIFRGNCSLIVFSPSRLLSYSIVYSIHCDWWVHWISGQPRRHLLQSGWSVFVSSKRLVAGDAFIFLRFVLPWIRVFDCTGLLLWNGANLGICRGENGELRVGVRRAMRQQGNVPSSVISSHSMHLGVLATAWHAISTGTIFTVYYKPRFVNYS